MRPNTLSIGQRFGAFVFFALFLSLHAPAAPLPAAGADLYKTHCSSCHDAGATRIPPRATLQQMTPDAIQKALTSGVMKQQGAALSQAERVTLAKWLSGTASAPQASEATPNQCVSEGRNSDSGGSDWLGWGAGAANWRYQPKPGLAASDVPRLKLKWAFGLPIVKMMRSQPAVYRGRVYLGGDNGSVFSLDAKSGCVYWSASMGNVRSGLTIGQAGTVDALFFGDANGDLHALDLTNGKQLWTTKISDHKVALITGTPAYANGRLYVPLSSYEEVMATFPAYACCSFRGSVASVNAANGKILWQTHTIAEEPVSQGKTKEGRELIGPSGASLWSSPTIDSAKNTIYITTGDNYSDPATKTSDAVMALDLESGKVLWSKQLTPGDVYNLACGDPNYGSCKNGNGPDFDFGASPILVTLASGKRCLLLGQKSGMVYAVDPDKQGEILWQARAGRGGALGGIQWGPATDGRTYFVALSDIGFRKSKDPKQLSPDPKVGGGMVAYRVDSGEVAWKAAPAMACGDRENCSPAQSAAVTAIPGAVFSGSLDGHLRAYSAEDGKVLWDFDTTQPFTTVNHVAATGGSMDVAGPVIAGGMVFATPGYPQYGGKPGNVLLAFGLE